MHKLQFTFKVQSYAKEPKTNVICVICIDTLDGRTFVMPDEYLDSACHKELIKTAAFAKVKKSIKQKGQYRKVWINLTTELENAYLDEANNLQFDGAFLEELIKTNPIESNVYSESVKQLLETFIEKTQSRSEEKNIGKIAKEFTIEKFNGKNPNVIQWMDSFEKECERFNITQDEKKIEILKSFMEKGASDWYCCTLLKLTIQENWEAWKRNFCETFANKGWCSVRYALQYKYQAGSLLEYAIKKEKLLLEIRNSIDNGTLIDLIAIGLPNFVTDRIDREKLKKTEDLYNEIGKLESLVQRKNFDKKNNKNYGSKEKIEKIPCEICKSEGKGTRFHPGASCWFKDTENKMKYVNNSILDVEISETDPKNS